MKQKDQNNLWRKESQYYIKREEGNKFIEENYRIAYRKKKWEI